MNSIIIDKEIEKSIIDMQVVQKLIKPSAVMFDPLQKSMLVGFFTNRDQFLSRLIPLLSIYIDQSKLCISMFQEIQSRRIEEQDAVNLKKQFETTFDLGWSICKELSNINKIAYPEEEPNIQQISDDSFVGYKAMTQQNKAKVLVDPHELKVIENMLKQRQAMAKQKGTPPDV